MDETPGSQERDEPNCAAAALHQEVPPFPSGANYHTEPYRRDDHMLRGNLLVYSGLLAISTVAMTQIIPISPLDRSLRVAVFAFAVAIPLLAASIMIDGEKTGKPINIDTRREWAMNIAGALASTVGVTSIFFHFGVVEGFAFIVISSFAVAVFSDVYGKLGEINQRRE